MVTLQNFGPSNRSRFIGNSFYEICLDEKTKQWYIHERYSNAGSLAKGKAFYSNDLKWVIEILNSFSKEMEVISLCYLIGPKQEPTRENKQEETDVKADVPAMVSETEKMRWKNRTISQELFKQMIFDILMESQDRIPEDVANAILDILDRYDVGSPWRCVEDKKPESGQYFFIKLNSSAEYRDPSWLKNPLLAKRVKGGFYVSGLLVPDQEVEAYSEILIPKWIPGAISGGLQTCSEICVPR